MNHRRIQLRLSLRRFALAAALLLGSFTALAGQSSASTLIPVATMGGPGGGGGMAAGALQHTLQFTANRDVVTAGVVIDPETDINLCFSCIHDGVA